MQNKGLIRLFAVLFGIVSIYQLSFTFFTGEVEEKAQEYAENAVPSTEQDYVAKREKLEASYLDSVGTQDKFLGFTYNDAKEKELNKGLDLKGGMNVILQISVKDILKGLANNSKNPVFNKALADADEALKSSDNTYLELFFDAFSKDADGKTKLASPDIFANKNLSDQINFNMSDDEVKPIIRKKIDESIVSAFEVLRKRIDKFGVTQPNIQRLGTSGRILVELPGAKDVDRVKKLLQSTAQLEFWETFKVGDVLPYLAQADAKLAQIQKNTKGEVKEEAKDNSEIDSLLSDAKTDSVKTEQKSPLLGLLAMDPRARGQNSPVVATFALKDTAQVNEFLKKPEIIQLRPNELRYAKFSWGKVNTDTQLIDLYALKGNRDNVPAMNGDVITDAAQTYDQMGGAAVSMQMNGKGAKEWEALTGKAFKEQGNIAIVLDDIVYSAPGVSKGAISGGRSEISGKFTVNEATDLANVLRAGKLPASANIIQFAVVGPSLGQEAIDNGMMSFLIAMALVLAWMIFYYGKAGWFADVALLFNILLIFGVLAGLGAVLTLPGIAGIVLTIGMSVDANVIIYERIKEEIAKGKSQKQAITDGFSNALSSILDANITTGLTALVLLIFGTGPIAGFATTLLIGILTSLFTAIFITRLCIDWYVGRRNKELLFTTALTRNFFKNVNFDFLGKRKIAYIASSAVILIGIASLFTQGLDQGIDFVGGRSYQIRFVDPVKPSEISAILEKDLGSTEVKTFGDPNQIKLTTKYKVDVEGSEVDDEIQHILFTDLQKYLPKEITYDDFKPGSSDTAKVGIMQAMKVGPTIASDIKIAAIWSIIGSLAVVFLYILLRFRRWQFSVGAIVALAHDVLITIGIFSLTWKFMPFGMEIDQAFIAAILTVIGYSLNDTVIVFDRIREITDEKGWTKGGANTNLALNSTLSRTLNTSLTTLVVLIAIFVFGGESLRGFMFAMIIGIVVGTYSSLFIATPVMFDALERKTLKEEKK
ncbi:protein translocase subunit SecDF [Zhouia sp. PK063]|uniref:protein translocase subunit SecDF n=1 Tax=Zhouia sp. PK063 TaxID=3373602 RepID=UPI0037B8F8B7